MGIEFYLGKQYALAANWHYAWWKSDPPSWYHRTYGGDLELRRYFGAKAEEKNLQGWHAGVYGQILTYDFEWGGRGYLGDRWSYAGGLSVGYSLPVRHRLTSTRYRLRAYPRSVLHLRVLKGFPIYRFFWLSEAEPF